MKVRLHHLPKGRCLAEQADNMCQSFEQKNIENLSKYISITDEVKLDLYKLANIDNFATKEIVSGGQLIPLFRHYPELKKISDRLS